MKKNTLLLLMLCVAGIMLQSCENALDVAIYDVIQDGQINPNESKSIKVDFENEPRQFTEDEMVARIMEVAENKDVDIDSSYVRSSLFPVSRPPKSVQVSVFLDNTLSMEGYAMAKNAESFTSVFAGINSYCSANNFPKCGYYVRKSGIEKIEYSELLSQLTHRSVPFTDSYQLDGFLGVVREQVAAKDSIDKICFFVTDGIPSGTNEEILKNERFNLDNRAILKTRIADQIRLLSDGNYAVAVYCFDANFNGIYYNYKNGHVPPVQRREGVQPWTNDIVRPFYVIAIGTRQLMTEFHESVVAGLQDFAPIDKLLFTKEGEIGKPSFADPTGETYFGANGSGGCQRRAVEEYVPYPYNYIDSHGESSDTIFVTKNPNGNGAKIEFYFKKNAFPSYLQDQLDSTLSIKYGNDIIPFVPDDGNKVRFTLDVANDGIAKTLVVKVRDDLPKWVQERNAFTDEKFTIENHDTTTLNLSVLIQGIHDGIFNTEGRVFLVEKKFIVVDVEDKE